MVSVSVIIPIYNVEPYVRRCLESVMAQDGAEAEIECIIVDDCGTDSSMDVVRQTLASYHGPVAFRVVLHELNRGLSAARNTGLLHAKGDYVLFVDSDDYLLPGSIGYFLDMLKAHPEADVVIGNVKNQKGNFLLINDVQKPLFITDASDFFRRMLNRQVYLYAWNKLIRRSVLSDHHISFIEGIFYEDQSWSYLLFASVSSVLLLPQVTYVYEYNAHSIVNSSFSIGRTDDVIHSYVVTIDYLLDNPPAAERYSRNMAVDYLLFMAGVLMRAFDVFMRFSASPAVSSHLRAARHRLVMRSWAYGRLLVSCFMLLFYQPFLRLQQLSFFRHHYYALEHGINVVAHLTDFLHDKNRL